MSVFCGDVYEEWAHDGLVLGYGETATCTKPPHHDIDGHYSEERKFGWFTVHPGVMKNWTQE